jgi:S1-C subfamily serine protease
MAVEILHPHLSYSMPSCRLAAVVVAFCWLALSGQSSYAPAAEVEDQHVTALQRIYAGGVPRSSAELRWMESYQQQLVEKLSPTIVNIAVGESQGSGVIISPDGFVLTAAHVAVKSNISCRITLHDGREFNGRTLGMNKGIDAGLVKIDEQPADAALTEWPYAQMGSVAELSNGAWCLAFGHPGGYMMGRHPVVRFGRVLSVNHRSLQTDCALVGGDSGGPLFDMNGRVIGIHSRIGADIAKNLHVPINTFRTSWDRLAKGESWGNFMQLVGPPMIGVLGVQNVDRAEVEKVMPGLPAERAGIQVGDIIVRFNGQAVRDFQSLKRLVSDCEPGEEVPVDVLRDNRRVQLTIIVGTSAG